MNDEEVVAVHWQSDGALIVIVPRCNSATKLVLDGVRDVTQSFPDEDVPDGEAGESVPPLPHATPKDTRQQTDRSMLARRTDIVIHRPKWLNGRAVLKANP
jgi:hypothetical protein